MGKYQVWLEGYRATGESGEARQFISPEGSKEWEAETFQEACKKALKAARWDMKYYNEKRNSFWACHFYDNEADARKSFG